MEIYQEATIRLKILLYIFLLLTIITLTVLVYQNNFLTASGDENTINLNNRERIQNELDNQPVR